MTGRERLLCAERWYQSTTSRGVVDPAALDEIIQEVFQGWARSIGDYELLCDACQRLDPHARSQMGAFITEQAK